MLKLAQTLSGNVVLKGTFIVTIGIVFASFFSYLLQIAVARLLSVEDYGIYNALLSLSVIITIPSVAFNNSIIKLVSELKAKSRFDTLTNFFVKINIGLLLFGALFLILIISLKDMIVSYLKLPTESVLFPFAIFIWLSYLRVAPAAYLQGLLRFKAFAFFNFVGSLLRLILPVVLILLGLKVGGIFWGFTLTIIMLFLISLWLLKKNFLVYDKENLNDYYKLMVSFGLATFFISVGMNLLNNLDVLLVKHYFDPYLAGEYAALVTVGKVYLFGASIVTVLMYPHISSLYAEKSPYSKVFWQYLLLQILGVFGGLIVFMALPALVTQVLFGRAFLNVVAFLPKFSIFVGLYILANFMIMFLLAVNKPKVWLFLIPSVALQYFLIALKHNTLHDVINANIASVALILFLVVIFFLRYVGFGNSAGLQAGKNN